MIDDLEILFDFDGTLVLTDDIYYKVWKQILCKDITREWYNTNIRGKSDKDVIKNFDLKEDISTEKDKLFLEYVHLEGIELVPGSIIFLQKCLDLKIPCGIVTNCNRNSVESILKHFHIEITITIGDECSRPKPFPDPYIKARQGRKTTIVFEDTPTGIQSAKSSGVD